MHLGVELQLRMMVQQSRCMRLRAVQLCFALASACSACASTGLIFEVDLSDSLDRQTQILGFQGEWQA